MKRKPAARKTRKHQRGGEDLANEHAENAITPSRDPRMSQQ
jgi:hypothetical protein